MDLKSSAKSRSQPIYKASWSLSFKEKFKTVPNAMRELFGSALRKEVLDWLWGSEVVDGFAIYRLIAAISTFTTGFYFSLDNTLVCNRLCNALYIIDLSLWIGQWDTDNWLTYTADLVVALLDEFDDGLCQHIEIKQLRSFLSYPSIGAHRKSTFGLLDLPKYMFNMGQHTFFSCLWENTL